MSVLLPTDAAYPRIRAAKLNSHWPASEPPFERSNSDFAQFAIKLEIFLQQCGLDRYIFAKAPLLITAPSDTREPHAYDNWLCNNGLIIGVIRAAVDRSEHEGLVTSSTAKDCFDNLKKRALNEGPVKQVALLRESLSTYNPITSPLEVTARKICELVDRAFDIGDINRDLFKSIALLNSINDKAYKALQTQISRGLADSTKDNPYRSSNIRKLFETMDSLSTLSKSSTGDTALAAKATPFHSTSSNHLSGHNHGTGQLCCVLCQSLGFPCRGHTKEWCVQQGGGQAGKTIEESRT